MLEFSSAAIEASNGAVTDTLETAAWAGEGGRRKERGAGERREAEISSDASGRQTF